MGHPRCEQQGRMNREGVGEIAAPAHKGDQIWETHPPLTPHQETESKVKSSASLHSVGEWRGTGESCDGGMGGAT